MDSAGHAPITHSDEVDWYYLNDGVQVGPLSERRLLEVARQNGIGPKTLIWQQGFAHWKEAATIPMVAVNLGGSGGPELELPSTLIGPEQGATTAPAQPGALVALELGDAVNEDEAAEPQLDLQQVREILHRASRPPPERGSMARNSRPPQERSIPPASVSTIPPGPERMRRVISVMRLVPFAAIPLSVGIIGVVLMTRAARRPASRPVMQPARAAESTRPPAPTAPEPRIASQAATSKPNHASLAPPASGNVEERVPQKSDLVPLESDLVSVTSGPLDVQILHGKLQRALPMFDQQCWNRLRVRVPNAPSNPSIRIEMSIDRNGNVYAIEATKSPRGYWGVGPCVIGRMRGWKFPRAESGSRAAVTVGKIHE